MGQAGAADAMLHSSLLQRYSRSCVRYKSLVQHLWLALVIAI
jgi:hypothetical protein